MPKITGTLQRAYFDTKKIEHLPKEIPLADSLPTDSQTANIELLLGNDYYCDIFSCEIPLKQVAPGLNLMKSKLGWILTGRIRSQGDQAAPSVSMLPYSSSPISAHIATSFNGPEPLVNFLPQVEDFWKLKTLGIHDSMAESGDDKALWKFSETVQFEDGRYHATWPWKEERPMLPSNYDLALGRLRSLVNRLMKNPDHLRKYSAVLQDQLEKGIIEVVPEQDYGETLRHYIPHHEVVTPEKTTTKLRIV